MIEPVSEEHSRRTKTAQQQTQERAMELIRAERWEEFLRMFWRVAVRAANRWTRTIPWAHRELVGAALYGMWIGAKRYDEDKGASVLTFVERCARGSVREHALWLKSRGVGALYFRGLGDVMRGATVWDAGWIAERTGMTVEDAVYHVNRWRVVSLDAPVTWASLDAHPDTFGSMVPSSWGLPDALFEEAEKLDRLWAAIPLLIPTHRRVVEAVIGGESFQDIGLRLGVTRQAIEQRYKKSVVALRRQLLKPA
jgi:RNA polymerase sigma factor (sigma-70 family)